MGAPLILWDITSDRGDVEGGDWLSTGGFSLANLRTPDLSELARAASLDAADTRLTVTLDRPRSGSALALLAHTAPPGSTYDVTFRLAPDGPPVYEAQGLPFWEPTVVWGSRPWGAFPWDGVDPDDYPGTRVAWHAAPSSFFWQALDLDIHVAAGGGATLDLGRLLVGEGYRPSAGRQPGDTIRPVDPSEVRRTDGGARIVRRRRGWREWRISLVHRTEAEALGVLYDLQARGKGADMLIVLDPDAQPAVRARLTLYGALADTADMVLQPSFDRDGERRSPRWSVTFTIEELI